LRFITLTSVLSLIFLFFLSSISAGFTVCSLGGRAGGTVFLGEATDRSDTPIADQHSTERENVNSIGKISGQHDQILAPATFYLDGGHAAIFLSLCHFLVRALWHGMQSVLIFSKA
jgi:hypothetical protein